MSEKKGRGFGGVRAVGLPLLWLQQLPESCPTCGCQLFSFDASFDQRTFQCLHVGVEFECQYQAWVNFSGAKAESGCGNGGKPWHQ